MDYTDTSKKTFVENVITMARNMQVNWCRIFAEGVLRVAERLKVVIESTFKEGCIWISVKFLGNNTEASHKNLHVIGFDWHPDWKEFELHTAVGFKNNYFNLNLFPALKGNSVLIQQIEAIFAPFHFVRCIRFNRITASIYADIKEYNSLAKYIDDVCRDGIYFPSMTPKECIKNLTNSG